MERYAFFNMGSKTDEQTASYGIRGVVHSWFTSYLNNRTQYTYHIAIIKINLRFFGEISSNGCRPPVTAGVSWRSATVGGCRVQHSPVEGLSRLRETNSQWEFQSEMVQGKKWTFEKISTNWQWHNFFSLEALVCCGETKRWSREWLKGYSTPCKKPSNESVYDVRTRATSQVRLANQVVWR